MEDLLRDREAIVNQLVDRIGAHSETTAARIEEWHRAYEAHRWNGDGITQVRTLCDHAVAHLDAQIERLRGEMESLRVRLAHIDAQIGAHP